MSEPATQSNPPLSKFGSYYTGKDGVEYVKVATTGAVPT